MDVLSRSLGQTIVSKWISLALISSAVLYLFQTFRSWYRLRHFKGPLLASLSRLWLARHVAGGRMHLDFQEINEKYGMFDDQTIHE
jgi:hypothetical protein